MASFLSDLGICQTVCPFRACICYSLCQEHTSLHLWHGWLLVRVQISAEVSPPAKVTVHSIKVALPPPRAASQFSPPCYPVSLSPRGPFLFEMSLFTFLSSGICKESVPSLAILFPTYSPALSTIPGTPDGLDNQANSAPGVILLSGCLINVVANFTSQCG